MAQVEPFTITFFGYICLSKKNHYLPVVRQKKGTTGASKKDFTASIVKDRKLSKKLMYLTEQVPAEYWGLKLKHPTILMMRYGTLPDFGSDRTGVYQTLEDILVHCQIIEDDSDLFNNGFIHWHPTVACEEEDRRIELMIIPERTLCLKPQ